MSFSPNGLVKYTVVNGGLVSGSAGGPTAGQVFPAGFRNVAVIQAIGTAPLYVSYNGQPAGPGNCNYVLKAATTLSGGDGGLLVDRDFNGVVLVSGGANCFFTAWTA